MTITLLNDIARVVGSYTVWNLVLIVVATQCTDPWLRGFALCNTMLIRVISFYVNVTDHAHVQEMRVSFGSDKAARMLLGAIAVGDFAMHVLPLVVVIGWARHITVGMAVLPVVTCGLYTTFANLKAVYGADFREGAWDMVPFMLWCYAGMTVLAYLTWSARMEDSNVQSIAFVCIVLSCLAATFEWLKLRHSRSSVGAIQGSAIAYRASAFFAKKSDFAKESEGLFDAEFVGVAGGCGRFDGSDRAWTERSAACLTRR